MTLVPGEGEGTAERVYVAHLDDADLAAGAPILMSDGLIALEVVTHRGSEIVARVIHGGSIRNNKGVAFPGTVLQIPAVTPKDEDDLAFGASVGFDLIAASFVSSGADLRRIRQLAPGTPVIAKIESAVGYGNLDDILEEAHGAMVARGDLGVELSMESVPRAQKDIIGTNQRHGSGIHHCNRDARVDDALAAPDSGRGDRRLQCRARRHRCRDAVGRDRDRGLPDSCRQDDGSHLP